MKSNRISRSVVLFGSMLMIALQLFTAKANATVIPAYFFDCTQSKTFTSTCVGNGYYANGWVGDAGYWIWNLNTTGYTGITMVFSTTKSSAAGPTSGQVYYNIGGGDVAVTGGSFTVTTSCVSKTITLPAACEGVTGLVIKIKMLGATANTATNRITSENVFNGTSASCAVAPAAGGTVTTGTNPVCAGASAALTLTGATGGAGISYQWQSSPNGSTWTNIVGATALSYNTPALTVATYYRVLVTCAALPSTPTASSTLMVNVNSVAVAPITGYTSPLIIGTPQTLSNTTAGGVWVSGNTSVATVSGGNLTGVFGGIAAISYQVTDAVTGCVGKQTINVNTVWPNTLALYAGSTGSNTNVIAVPGDHTSALYAVGFDTTTRCANGGLSGLTLDTVANAAFDINGPHVGYKVYPDTDSALNMYRIHANVRVSGTGATKAVIAYRFWSGFSVSGWKVSADTADLTSSSCGVMSNSFDFNTGLPVNPNPTENGITDSLEVAVFPFAPGSNGGTFQLGSLEVYGIVTGNDPCDGSPIVSADSALPAVATICDSGYRFLNYNLGSGGVAGVEITYQWQSSPDGVSWTDIPFAEGAVYKTDTLHAGATSDTSYYRVQVLCSGTPVGESTPSMVVVSPSPADAGTISGGVVSTILPLNHMLIGAPTYTMSSTAGTGGVWSSNDTSVVSIVANTGVATPHIPGDAVITYRKSIGGCFGTTKKTVISLYDHTKALYVGSNGNSTTFYTSSDVVAVGTPDLTTANWTAAVTCGSGGISGLSNSTTAQNDATNGRVVVSIQAATTPISATQIRATLRKQPSGAYKAYLGYRTGSGAWTLSAPVNVETDDCGYSHNEITFAAPVSVDNTTNYDFAVFGYNGTSTTTLQVNSISVIGTGGSSLNRGSATGLNNVLDNAAVQVYPNPVENTLNIDATEAVNVAIFSIDGKKLLDQKNVKTVDVSNLVSGMYLIKVSNQSNVLLKTEKFIKK